MENTFTPKPNKKRVFTDEMRKHLKDNYHLMSLEELAEYYGLNTKQVKNQAERQYLSKRKPNK